MNDPRDVEAIERRIREQYDPRHTLPLFGRRRMAKKQPEYARLRKALDSMEGAEKVDEIEIADRPADGTQLRMGELLVVVRMELWIVGKFGVIVLVDDRGRVGLYWSTDEPLDLSIDMLRYVASGGRPGVKGGA